MKSLRILILSFVFAFSASAANAQGPIPNIADYRLDFTVVGMTGDSIKLSSLKGKVFLLDFWASWCGPCRYANKQLVKFSMIDTIVALSLAGLVNGAILVVSAATFHTHNVVIDSIDVAYKTLTPLLGNLSSYAFAIALLASGLASSVVATLSGQVIFEGFTNLKIKLWKRRIVTRLITLVPAIIAISLGVSPLSILVISQVVLSIQLPFTVVPLVYLPGRKK